MNKLLDVLVYPLTIIITRKKNNFTLRPCFKIKRNLYNTTGRGDTFNAINSKRMQSLSDTTSRRILRAIQDIGFSISLSQSSRPLDAFSLYNMVVRFMVSPFIHLSSNGDRQILCRCYEKRAW